MLAASTFRRYFVAAKLENGIELTLDGEITSICNIKMTLALLNDLISKNSFEGNVIKVYPKQEVRGKKWLLNLIGALHHNF
jgi:3-phosphoshikimate 1-carboxyvinyltransferase